ncbi:hypothetical protein N7456_013113 [Penicillium angulare]|uniref:Protein kinase domain-containing protein n=1 Tax=Penicillium angulare TaxID=116970 RepID=A0A9W9JW89_9EURO|nr:hypothetical protein N7456_013113 [Penicillium angulare]
MQRLETATPIRFQHSEDYDMDFGDFARDEKEELDIEDLTEPWYYYDSKNNTRVFYPIRLGELLNERYLIEHKLGHGDFSTVWMAYDLQERKNVALKVMSPGGCDENETRIQAEIKQRVQDKSHLVVYLNTFLLPWKNDTYSRALVLPLMGPCMSWHNLTKSSMAARMSAAQQLLRALESLHQVGIVHRDLHANNCMWGVSSLQDLTRTAKYQKLGRPLKQTIPFVELWKPGELVRPASIPDELRTADFFLGDFGIATKLNDPTFQIQRGYPPNLYSSPDRLHGQDPSFACDMWSYMVLFAELYLDFPPFWNTASDGGIIADFLKSSAHFLRSGRGLENLQDVRIQPNP